MQELHLWDASKVNNEPGGLRCDVKVKKQGHTCANYGNHLPCRQWNDFFPPHLETTDSQGKLATGKYTISYVCKFVLRDGQHVPGSSSSNPTLHTFEVARGCDPVLPLGLGANAEVELAKYILLGADEFVEAECNPGALYSVKESVFRKYDTDPEDGMLSYKEIESALIRQC